MVSCLLDIFLQKERMNLYNLRDLWLKLAKYCDAMLISLLMPGLHIAARP
jgi:hypothetical protein